MTPDERTLGERGLGQAPHQLDIDLRAGECPLPSLAETVAWLDALAGSYPEGLGTSPIAAYRDNDPSTGPPVGGWATPFPRRTGLRQGTLRRRRELLPG